MFKTSGAGTKTDFLVTEVAPLIDVENVWSKTLFEEVTREGTKRFEIGRF